MRGNVLPTHPELSSLQVGAKLLLEKQEIGTTIPGEKGNVTHGRRSPTWVGTKST